MAVNLWSLVQATAALQAVKSIGMPECNLALMQCTVYLAMAPKCNALYTVRVCEGESVRV